MKALLWTWAAVFLTVAGSASSQEREASAKESTTCGRRSREQLRSSGLGMRKLSEGL